MSLHNYRDVLYMFMGVWGEQGTPHSHCDVTFIPPLYHRWHAPTWLRMLYLYVSFNATPFVRRYRLKTKPRPVCLDVYCTCEQGTSPSAGLTQWGNACVLLCVCLCARMQICVNSWIWSTLLTISSANGLVVWLCVCVFCSSPRPRLQSAPCPGHESSTGKNVLRASIPPDTP